MYTFVVAVERRRTQGLFVHGELNVGDRKPIDNAMHLLNEMYVFFKNCSNRHINYAVTFCPILLIRLPMQTDFGVGKGLNRLLNTCKIVLTEK